MTWPFARGAQPLEAALARAAALDRELYHAQKTVEQLEAQLAAAEHREGYWRRRAENFIDQIALRQGNISAPVMTEAPAPPRDAAAGLFGALAIGEINSKSNLPRLTVSAVDQGKASAAVAEVLA